MVQIVVVVVVSILRSAVLLSALSVCPTATVLFVVNQANITRPRSLCVCTLCSISNTERVACTLEGCIHLSIVMPGLCSCPSLLSLVTTVQHGAQSRTPQLPNQEAQAQAARHVIYYHYLVNEFDLPPVNCGTCNLFKHSKAALKLN